MSRSATAVAMTIIVSPRITNVVDVESFAPSGTGSIALFAPGSGFTLAGPAVAGSSGSAETIEGSMGGGVAVTGVTALFAVFVALAAT